MCIFAEDFTLWYRSHLSASRSRRLINPNVFQSPFALHVWPNTSGVRLQCIPVPVSYSRTSMTQFESIRFPLPSPWINTRWFPMINDCRKRKSPFFLTIWFFHFTKNLVYSPLLALECVLAVLTRLSARQWFVFFPIVSNIWYLRISPNRLYKFRGATNRPKTNTRNWRRMINNVHTIRSAPLRNSHAYMYVYLGYVSIWWIFPFSLVKAGTVDRRAALFQISTFFFFSIVG